MQTEIVETKEKIALCVGQPRLTQSHSRLLYTFDRVLVSLRSDQFIK